MIKFCIKKTVILKCPFCKMKFKERSEDPKPSAQLKTRYLVHILAKHPSKFTEWEDYA